MSKLWVKQILSRKYDPCQIDEEFEEKTNLLWVIGILSMGCLQNLIVVLQWVSYLLICPADAVLDCLHSTHTVDFAASKKHTKKE